MPFSTTRLSLTVGVEPIKSVTSFAEPFNLLFIFVTINKSPQLSFYKRKNGGIKLC